MGLSHDIISEFVRITNDKKEKPKEGIVYGVVAQTSDGNYVKIDGSDLITPAETTTEVQDGERVAVMIKDHTATITGNVTSPSANSNSINKKFESVSDKIGTFELIVADKISANELEVYKATIDVLIAGKATIHDLEVVNATIEHLYAQNATIENLVANKASIKDLDVVNATIENLKAKDAEIEHAMIDHLEATLADIKVLNADFAQIRTLVNGNLTSDNILSFNITSDKVTMEDAFIKDAMIANVSAAKINAGKINTNNVTIGSEDGGMLITGSTQQFVDKDGNVRIQIGRDAKGDFTFILYGEDGVGQLINQNGITASAISDGLIVNDMVSDKAAISGEKLDISSVITEINNDNSTTIKSNKIYLNEQEQSLEVAFNSLKTQVETIKDITVSGDLTSVIDRVQANTTEIEVNKERINTLILEDSIIKKQVTDLEGDVVETSTTLASKYSELDQTIEGFKTSVADTYATKSTVNDISNNLSTNYSTTSAMNSAIEQKVDEINLSISETYATNETVNDINDNLLKNYSTTSVMNSAINQKVDEIKLEVTQTINNIQTGGKNLIKNGNFEDGLNHWVFERFTGCESTSISVWTGNQNDFRDEWCMDGKKHCAVYAHDIDDSNRRGEWTVRQSFQTVVGQEYTVSYMIAGHRSNKTVAVTENINWDHLGTKYYGDLSGGKNANGWVYDSITFTATTPESMIWFIMSEVIWGNDGHLWFTDVCCVEGNKAQRFIPSLEEYSTTSQMNSAITQNATQIAMTVSKEEIKNTKIGGANLLLNSDDKKQLDRPETTWNSISYNIVDDYANLTLNNDTTFVLSFTVDRNGNMEYECFDSIAFDNGWYHRWYRDDIDKITYIKGGSTYKFVMKPKTLPKGTTIADKLSIIAEYEYGGAAFYNVMLAEGDKTLDWSPSNQDIQNSIARIDIKADEINSTVSTTIKEEVQNIKIGGTNLLGSHIPIRGIYQITSFVRTNDTSFEVIGHVDNDGTVRISDIIDGNGWYTISFDVKCQIEGWNVDVDFCDGAIKHFNNISTTDYTHCVYSYEVTNYTSDVYCFIDICGLSSQTFWFKNIKVERGKIATDYSPCPSDYSTTTQMNSAITQKADEINLTVNKIKRGARVARWVRCYMYGNTFNSGNHIVQVQVWSNGTNLALGKIPYSNGVLDNPDRMTDGNLDTNIYAELHPNGGDIYWEIDLGDEYSIDDITLWNYYGDSRRYHYILVTYDHNWEDLGVYNTWVGGTYVETSSGKNFVLNSSTINNNLAQIDIKADSIKLKVDAVDSDLKNNYPTTTQMNSAIQLKADSITSAVNMTAIAGVELLPQSHRRNSTSGYHVRYNGELYVNEWGLYVPTANTWVTTDFIAIDPGLPLKYYFFMQNTRGYSLLTYLGFEQYNWKKQEIGENAATIYVVQEKFSGYKSVADTIPENSFNSNTRYIKLRWLVNWDGSAMAESYLHDATVKQLGSINQSTQIAQMSDKIESTVSSVNTIGGRVSTAESKITQHADQIATKVDVNGVKSTIQQNPESVRIGFNGISNYFDLNSTRLQVGHSDGSYTQIGQNGVTYYANGSGNRYHNLMKQGWTETVAMSNYGANGWSLIVTLPPEFRGKVFSVIPCLTYVSCPNLADAIKGFEINIPQEHVNYNQGSFVIHLYASGLWAEGLSIHYNVQMRITWIAIA